MIKIKARYILRLDDACPTMKKENWNKIEYILNEYNIKPIVAVIPDCKDEKLKFQHENHKFWDIIQRWFRNGWEIALHGYNHLYVMNKSGIIPINDRSEFAGLSIEDQRLKIKKGLEIFKQHNLNPRIFIAPSHTFDEVTLEALKLESNIRIINDGLAFYPYYSKGFYWIPQQLWKPQKKLFGIWTICVHPNTMNNRNLNNLFNFIKNNHKYFISVNEIPFYKRNKNTADYILEKTILFKLKVIRKILSIVKE